MTAWREGLPDEWGYDRYGESPYYRVPDGWSILASHDWAGDYEFSMVVVWRDEQSGELRGAGDSGCSCPTPFGDLDLSDAKLIESVEDLRPLVAAVAEDADWDGVDEGVASLKAAVHRALRDGAASQ